MSKLIFLSNLILKLLTHLYSYVIIKPHKKGDFMNYQILSNLIIKDFDFISTIYSEKNKSSQKTNRPRWALGLKTDGETIYKTKSGTYLSNKDNLIILPKGCIYKWKCIEPGHFSAIEFECDLECDDIFSLPLKNSEKIHRLFKEIEYKHLTKKPMYKMEIIKNCYSIILEATKEKKYIPNAKQLKIMPALEYITQNFDKPIKNEDLAKVAGLSNVYFRKIFTDVIGTSPNAYIHKIRIDKAKEMLKSEYSNISEIAASLGYPNIYDFSRDFKKHVGIPPSKY